MLPKKFVFSVAKLARRSLSRRWSDLALRRKESTQKGSSAAEQVARSAKVFEALYWILLFIEVQYNNV